MGCESCVKIGYDYGRSVTGTEHEVEPDLNDEDQILVPDPQEERTMVATSSGVRTCTLTFSSDCSHAVVCLIVFLFRKCTCM